MSHQLLQIIIGDFRFLVRHFEKLVVDRLESLFVEVEANLLQSVLEAMATAPGRQHNLTLQGTHEQGINDFVGGALL